MAKSKQQKHTDLEELTQKLKTAKGIVLTDYRGATVKDMDKFRRTLEKEQVFAKVYKVTLLKKALQANGVDASSIDYKTPVILAMSETEETLPASLVKNLSKDIKTINMVSGILENKIMGKNEVMALADLPSKHELRGQLVRTINAPVSGFVNVLAGNVRSLLNVLNAIAAK